MEAARILKANMKIDGKPCGWCQAALRLGDDAAVCNACEKEHHRQCWDGRAGCSTAGCVSAPLRRLDAQPAGGSPYPQSSAPQAGGYPPGSPFPQGGSPFPQGPAPASYGAPSPPPGFMFCPHCRSSIIAGADICPMCRAITSPDGIYHGVKLNAPGAVASLVCGIIGIFVCGFILGPIAISKANSAKRAISSDPTLGGEGYATAGTVLGIIAVILHVLVLLIRLGGGL